jgi:histidinol dehydrogenase
MSWADPDPVVLCAVEVAGVDRVFRVGGAQAVAAMAYGAAGIPKVDKIVGPGNAYVAAAKRMVFGQVDIDMVAGPSEILVVADGSAPARFAAADLLSQAEHDELASAILLTPSADYADEVEREVAALLAHSDRRLIACASLESFGGIVVTRDLEEALDIASQIAPEHLELLVERPLDYLRRVRHAGAVFLGPWSPEPMGDYLAGPNHVLPTGGTARFSSPLGVEDFLKKTSVIGMSEGSMGRLGPCVIRLAGLEGLDAHARSVQVRLDELAGFKSQK